MGRRARIPSRLVTASAPTVLASRLRAATTTASSHAPRVTGNGTLAPAVTSSKAGATRAGATIRVAAMIRAAVTTRAGATRARASSRTAVTSRAPVTSRAAGTTTTGTAAAAAGAGTGSAIATPAAGVASEAGAATRPSL